jgi:hypothetical protein
VRSRIKNARKDPFRQGEAPQWPAACGLAVESGEQTTVAIPVCQLTTNVLVVKLCNF